MFCLGWNGGRGRGGGSITLLRARRGAAAVGARGMPLSSSLPLFSVVFLIYGSVACRVKCLYVCVCVPCIVM